MQDIKRALLIFILYKPMDLDSYFQFKLLRTSTEVMFEHSSINKAQFFKI